MATDSNPRGSLADADLYRLVNQVPAVLWSVNRDLVFTASMGAGLATLGLEPGQVIGVSLWEYFHTTDETFPPLAAHLRALEGHSSTYETPWEGKVFLTRTEPLRDDAGNIVGAIGTAHDVTAQKQAESWLATVLRCIGDAVIATDRDANIRLMNPIAEQLTGWSAAEAMGRPLDDCLHLISGRTRERVQSPARQVLASGGAVGLANGTILIHRNGDERLIADSAAPLVADDGSVEGVVIVFRDVTTEHQLEREANKAQRLESIGVLAGGIAHDFNNMLAMISANTSLLRARLLPEPRVDQALDDTEQACRRATGLTQQLLTFARGGAPMRAVVSLAELVRETVGFATHGTAVRVSIDIDADLWPADVDEGQISQAIGNLLLNACEAMPDGGTVHVEACNREVSSGEPLPVTPGRYVELHVRDTGPGIDPSIIDRVFDPYFTTKASGSGLGLASAYSVARRHDGHLRATSTVGEGSTFSLLLPASDRTAVATTAYVPPAPQATRRVLLLEDEDLLARAFAALLEELGHECVAVPDGAEAVDAYVRARADGTPFELAILDLTVPGGMGGVKTLAALREVDPDVVAIAASGYATDPVMAHPARAGFSGVLRKPFTADELAEALDAVLRESKS